MEILTSLNHFDREYRFLGVVLTGSQLTCEDW